MAAILNLGRCLIENDQFEKALPLLERSLSIMRENLPGDHLDIASGEIICILLLIECICYETEMIKCRDGRKTMETKCIKSSLLLTPSNSEFTHPIPSYVQCVNVCWKGGNMSWKESTSCFHCF